MLSETTETILLGRCPYRDLVKLRNSDGGVTILTEHRPLTTEHLSLYDRSCSPAESHAAAVESTISPECHPSVQCRVRHSEEE